MNSNSNSSTNPYYVTVGEVLANQSKPDGMNEIKRCKAKTKMPYFPYLTSITCSRKEWKDGYCKIHHPEEKLRRQKERNSKKDVK